MERFMLVHEGQRILLPDGETVVGRGPSCNIRFKDPSVSREHVRIVVLEGRAAAANLSTNGTMLNGRRLIDPTRLRPGDELRIGFQSMRIETVSEAPRAELSRDMDDYDAPSDETRATSRMMQLEHGALGDDDLTQPGVTGFQRRRRRQTIEPVLPSSMAEIRVHVCPRCSSRIAFNEDSCATCAYAWPHDLASALTQDVNIEHVGTRRDPRYVVRVPVVYSSATLTVDGLVRDLSRGGVFIATEVLDPVGTPCDLTAIPDGSAALRFSGVVAHVREELSPVSAPGLGIQFIGGARDALDWLDRTIAHFGEAVVIG
ncbi:MAG TPA: FHA domain-containing protein [Kofleriaceae bacterium]|nr:FHA domain-containing protein [Kofleriaceae bacterium]